MRTLLAVCVLAIVSQSLSAADDGGERFPYSAFVAAEQTPVRSGPGEQFYPVLDLKHGDAVEVWRHDPGGWCAIRPPAGSFSWVSADFIRPINEKLAAVAGREVNIRVGTQFSDMRDVVQLQLNDGDQVAILGSRRLTEGDREAWWYKVLPPAGEFRWIHEKYLVRHPDHLPPPSDVVRTNDPFAGRQVAFNEPAVGTDVKGTAANAEATADPAAVLDELEGALSRIVTAEPTAWHFAELKHRAEGLLERAESAVERSRARMFLGKLARFEDIRRRYAQIAEARTQTAAVDQQLAGNEKNESAVKSPATEIVSRIGSVDVSRYDGVGRMTQIVTNDSGSPTFALTDERGEVVAFVTAAPGVNLRQYAGLEVGINGIKGFITDKRMAQLTAKRVDVLSTRAAAAATTRR